MYEKNNHFQNKSCCFRNTLPNVLVKIWDYPPRRMCWRTSRTVMVLIRNDLLDYLPTLFSGNSSCEIPFATIFIFFHKIHVMHTHLIPRLSRAYKMHYVISTQFISHMKIYHHAYIYITKAHNTCYAHSSSISPKISSHGLIYNYKQFDLNYSTKHIISQNIS